jgi:glycosyltransferase involved in cell wall biosynthesis
MMHVTRPTRIALIRQGDRPRLNQRLGELLAMMFPEYEVDDIDVLALVRSRPLSALRASVGAAAENIERLATRRIDSKKALITSQAFADVAARLIHARVAPTTHAFTFQSQSLFPAAVPGVPHFVYTDHAHLANLGYPGFDVRGLAGRRFLARERETYHSACAVFVRSEHVRDVITSTYAVSPRRVRNVGVGPNVSREYFDADRPWHGGRILFVGVDWERKGGSTLLSAFRGLHAQRPSTRLEIVGCEPRIGDVPGVTVHGRVSTDEVGRLMGESDIFCMPTRAEPFGVAFIEAMHAGLPTVGTNIGAIPDFVKRGVTGRLVEPDDPTGLSEALLTMVDNPAWAQAMGREGRSLARRTYDWQPVMSAIRSEIRERLEQCNTAADTHSAEHSRRHDLGAVSTTQAGPVREIAVAR